MVVVEDSVEVGVEFGKVERFGQVIIGFQFEFFDFVVQCIFCGDDEYVCFWVYLFEQVQEVEAVFIGQYQVEQYNIIVEGQEVVLCFCKVVCGFVNYVVMVQICLDVVYQFLLIFYYE